MSVEPISETRCPPVLADRVIYRRDLCAMLGIGSECLRRWIRDKKFPPPDIAITRRTVGWRLSTLQAAGIGLV